MWSKTCLLRQELRKIVRSNEKNLDLFLQPTMCCLAMHKIEIKSLAIMELLSVGMKALKEILAMETTDKSVYSVPFIPKYCVNMVSYVISYGPINEGTVSCVYHYIAIVSFSNYLLINK